MTLPGEPPIVELTLSTKPKLVRATPLSFFRTTVARLAWPWNTVAPMPVRRWVTTLLAASEPDT